MIWFGKSKITGGVSETVSGSVIQCLTFHEFFSGNLVNVDNPEYHKHLTIGSHGPLNFACSIKYFAIVCRRLRTIQVVNALARKSHISIISKNTKLLRLTNCQIQLKYISWVLHITRGQYHRAVMMQNHGAKGLRKNKSVILGAETPGRKLVKSHANLDILKFCAGRWTGRIGVQNGK